MDILQIYQDILGDGIPESRDGSCWRFTCPLCSTPYKMYVNIEKSGVFVCYGLKGYCEYKGNIYTFLKDCGRKIDGKIDLRINITKEYKEEVDWNIITNVYTHICEIATLKEEHRYWLYGRGIHPEGFYSTDGIFDSLRDKFSDIELQKAGLLSEKKATSVIYNNRIIIPYRNKDNSICFIRSRGSNGIRYLSPAGVPQNQMIWGTHDIEDYRYIIITEGEFKAQAAKQAGFSCIALPGMMSSHKAAALFAYNKKIPRVYILFDSEFDKDKRRGVDKQASNLAKILSEYNITVYRAQLPLLGEEKMDIDKFLLLRKDTGVKEMRLLLREAIKI